MRIYQTLFIALLLSETLIAQVPTINTFSPASGPVGTTVTITGTNFSATTQNNIIFFGPVRANVITATSTSLTVTVPAGANFQPISVSVNGLAGYSSKPFIVTFPGAGSAFAASSFTEPISYAAGKGPACVATGDFDGDGKPDMVEVNDTPNTVSVFRNLSISGTASFSSKTDFSTGNKPFCVAVGDLDGDGKPDLAVTNAYNNSLSIFRNTSTGTGIISFAAKIDLITGVLPFCVVISDFDKDGKPDLATANNTDNTISIFRNTSTTGLLSFSLKSDLATGTAPFWITAADLDNDGKPELATANISGANSVSVLQNTSTPGSISFAPKADFDPSNHSYSITIGDIDGDGKPDLVLAGEAASVLLNTSTGTGNISFGSRTTFSTGGSSDGVTIGDMDGDGKPDVVVANSYINSVSVLKNTSIAGAVSFYAKKDFITGTHPWVAVAVDVDGDSKPEIITANNGSANISVLRNVVSALGIESFTPASAGAGTTVTITGTNFTGITGVSFGGIAATSVTVLSSSSISAVIGAGASGSVKITTGNLTASLAGFTFLPPPTITSFTPAIAGTGDTVIITGTNLTGATAVNFGGVQASSFVVDSSTKITAVVAAGASGNVSVTSPGGTVSKSGFTYDNTPSITSFNPNKAGTGDTVLLNGHHLLGTTLVTFGGITAASFTVVSSNIITAIVGAGASGNIMVINNAGSASISGFTYVPPPSISSFSPPSAGSLQTIIITGNNFNGATAVTFGSIPASSFIVNSNTSITAVIAGGSSGSIKVITPGGVSFLAGFIYLSPPVPVVNSFSPISGPVGTTVTITGANFSPVTSSDIVYFGAAKALVLTASGTSLTVKVPAGATYRPILITTDKNLTAFTAQPFVITFPGNVAAFTANSFATKVDFTTGTYPRCVVINDLDGDGRSDMVVVNGVSNTISVFKNINTDSVPIFNSKIDLNTNNAPISISTGDLDGDGRADLIVTNSNSGGASDIWIYRNISSNGNILFAPKIELATGSGSVGTDVGDFDGDGRPDIAVTSSNSAMFSILRNVSTAGKIFFAAKTDFYFDRGDDIAIGDLDGDMKPDLVITNTVNNVVSLYRNTSSIEVISFADKIDLGVDGYPLKISIGDLDGDNKADLAIINFNSNSLSILKNVSTTGVISFEAAVDYPTIYQPRDISITDLDGDAKPDLVIGSNTSGIISIYKNISSTGQILFATNADYATGNYSTYSAIGDLNGDGRPEIAVANSLLNTVSILRNKIGEVNPILRCPPMANTSIASNLSGSNYQWQIDTGTGFTNISNGTNYTGSNMATIQLSNIPSSWYGYKYRCLVDGNNSDVSELKFSDSWTGSVSNAWENSSNWTCGAIPDNNTDAVIDSGTITINSNVTVRSLKIKPGASLTVKSGFNLTVLH